MTGGARNPGSIRGAGQERDTADLEQLYRLLFPPLVRRAVRRHGLSFEDAADVVQDAFVVAVNRLDPAKNPRAWLTQVVDYLAVNCRRKGRRRAQLLERWERTASAGERSHRVSSDE